MFPFFLYVSYKPNDANSISILRTSLSISTSFLQTLFSNESKFSIRNAETTMRL